MKLMCVILLFDHQNGRQQIEERYEPSLFAAVNGSRYRDYISPPTVAASWDKAAYSTELQVVAEFLLRGIVVVSLTLKRGFIKNDTVIPRHGWWTSDSGCHHPVRWQKAEVFTVPCICNFWRFCRRRVVWLLLLPVGNRKKVVTNRCWAWFI